MCEGLGLWKEISKFIHTTKVEDCARYELEMTRFEMNVRSFYECGSKTFLTQTTCGDRETFYLHCLRFYLPEIMHTTWDEHGLGLGVFTMQGFERRNKESKNTMKRFSNRKGNMTSQNMKRLWDVFFYGKNAY